MYHAAPYLCDIWIMHGDFHFRKFLWAARAGLNELNETLIHLLCGVELIFFLVRVKHQFHLRKKIKLLSHWWPACDGMFWSKYGWNWVKPFHSNLTKVPGSSTSFFPKLHKPKKNYQIFTTFTFKFWSIRESKIFDSNFLLFLKWSITTLFKSKILLLSKIWRYQILSRHTIRLHLLILCHSTLLNCM